MKKVMQLTGIAGVALLLSACSSERDDYISEAKSHEAVGDLDSAFDYLMEANAIQGFDPEEEEDLIDMQNKLGNDLYEENMHRGTRLKEEREFEESLELLYRAEEIVPGYFEELDDAIREVETLYEKEQEFHGYLSFYEETMQESNELLSLFQGYLNEARTGAISQGEFSNKVNEEVTSRSNSINETMDSEIYNIDAELISIHQSFTNVVDDQHTLFMDAVEHGDVTQLSDFHNTYVQIKQDQASVIQSLRAYAETEQINFKVSTDTENMEEEVEEEAEVLEEEQEE